jgi:superfamily II DNA or RNA helicase
MVTSTGQPAAGFPVIEPGSAARVVLRDAAALRAAIARAGAAPQAARQAARLAYQAMRSEIARRELAKMPLDRIRDVTRGGVRLGPLEKAGYRTVGQVLAAHPAALDAVPGVGPDTVTKVVAAARQLELAVEQETRVRFNPDARTPQQSELLARLRAYELAKSLVPPQAPDLGPLAAAVDFHGGIAAPLGSKVRTFFTGAARKQQARDSLGQLASIISSPFARGARQRISAAEQAQTQDPARLWNDFLARPVAYNGLLIEVAELAPDRAASQGFLPADLADRIHQFPLDLSLMTVSLRGYQAFGAKFGLVQERVILGDEMGLGKTVEALAAMCHLAAEGARHFLVVCPASVLVNWTREVRQHTTLESYRLHGEERERGQRTWAQRGGVAVTTYEVLRSMAPDPGIALGMLVVDEAHYAKNPATLRSKAVRAWAVASRRVLFLTGTPMENRVDEFRVLVSHLRPDIAGAVRDVDGALGSNRFRKAVAPVYLRRNQDDVLSELPERLETAEWVALEGPALAAYRLAVFEGNFMAMRRAAFAPGTVDGSAKLERLVDIVTEATADGRKVAVFSFFRDVLDIVARTLAGIAIGPVTGDVPPPRRQALVDDFTARDGPAVLVAQIQAGGVGLNIQAASVVILTEPQWTPAAEDQAIARAHRLGQVRRVDVHRLLAEDSVDSRMLDLLHGKRIAFDEYARRSDLKESTPDAVDVSDLEQARKAASQAEAQRRIVEMEQRRLRAGADLAEPRELA